MTTTEDRPQRQREPQEPRRDQERTMSGDSQFEISEDDESE